MVSDGLDINTMMDLWLIDGQTIIGRHFVAMVKRPLSGKNAVNGCHGTM